MRVALAVLGIWLMAGTAQGELKGEHRAALLDSVEAHSSKFTSLSEEIWRIAELGYKEHKSSALLQAALKDQGFAIKTEVAGIPTAFSATYGSGKPVIAILGEFDALPGLSQEVSSEKKARVEGGGGHACGHNLFGAGSALAAVGVKEFLEKNKLAGTVRFYGCPAEEGGGGKIYMARGGAFEDCDIILHWHPGAQNVATMQSNLANISAKFRFHGQSAHAAGSPERGRSSLDAVVLMTHAVDLLREHVPQQTRMHYVITHGGTAPNAVPDFAEVYLYARHPEMDVLDGIWERIRKCADAGALATETRLEYELINSSYSILPNDSLTKLMDRHLRGLGGLQWSDDEMEFARKLQQTLPGPKPSLSMVAQIGPIEGGISYGSTDVGDVSWLAPTGGIRTVCMPPGISAHSWQATASTGHSIGVKGMMLAAKTISLSAGELFTSSHEVEAARHSFEESKGKREYRSRIPMEQKPPLKYRD